MFNRAVKSIMNMFNIEETNFKYELRVFILNEDNVIQIKTNYINKIIDFIEKNRYKTTFLEFKYCKHTDNYMFERLGFTIDSELNIIPIRDKPIKPELMTNFINDLYKKKFKKINNY